MTQAEYLGRVKEGSNDDPVISEINWLICEIYLPAHNKMNKLSKLTRSVSVLFVIWALTLLSYFCASELFNGLAIFSQTVLWDGYDFNWMILSSVPSILLAIAVSFRNFPFNSKTKKDKWQKTQSCMLCLFNVPFFVILLFGFSKETVAIAGLICLAGFFITYMCNRLFGYTSSSIRNQTLVHHLKRLKREYEIACSQGNKTDLPYIQEQTFAHLFEMIEQGTNRRDKEVMGDHYKVHDSAVSWIKGLRK